MLERERREKKSNLSPAISLGFAGRNSVSQELKLLYATRATREHQNNKISPRSKVRVFMKTKKRRLMQGWDRDG